MADQVPPPHRHLGPHLGIITGATISHPTSTEAQAAKPRGQPDRLPCVCTGRGARDTGCGFWLRVDRRACPLFLQLSLKAPTASVPCPASDHSPGLYVLDTSYLGRKLSLEACPHASVDRGPGMPGIHCSQFKVLVIQVCVLTVGPESTFFLFLSCSNPTEVRGSTSHYIPL
jgi:hypothetical protein